MRAMGGAAKSSGQQGRGQLTVISRVAHSATTPFCADHNLALQLCLIPHRPAAAASRQRRLRAPSTRGRLRSDGRRASGEGRAMRTMASTWQCTPAEPTSSVAQALPVALRPPLGELHHAGSRVRYINTAPGQPPPPPFPLPRGPWGSSNRGPCNAGPSAAAGALEWRGIGPSADAGAGCTVLRDYLSPSERKAHGARIDPHVVAAGVQVKHNVGCWDQHLIGQHGHWT